MKTTTSLVIERQEDTQYMDKRKIQRVQDKFPFGRLLVVSNRLPITISKNETGEVEVCPSSGGLVTALSPVLRRSAGLWTGWPGTTPSTNMSGHLNRISEGSGYKLETVMLSQKELDDYYLGFSNQTLWPLFHDFGNLCKIDSGYWNAYLEVNRKFAQVVAEISNPDDYVWVHDYHLLLVAKELRRFGVKRNTGFFLHTPFPAPDLFRKLPWHREIINSMLDCGLIGFQTRRDLENFLWCLDSLIGDLHYEYRDKLTIINSDGGQTAAGVFPISIDITEFETIAMKTETVKRADQIRQSAPDCQIILGVDRLDYSKGITLRLKSYLAFLERFRKLHRKVSMIQVVVPSRAKIPEYQNVKKEIERLVREINDRFSNGNWTPVKYLYGGLNRPELIAYYRAADIALITPVKDGMNLVAKEYCAANFDNKGVLILSEFAGAASQMWENALMINPYDIDGVANTVYRAYCMSPEERVSRMQNLRRSVHAQDIYWWSNQFLQSAKKIALQQRAFVS